MSDPINVYTTLNSPPDPLFPHHAFSRRDRSDPDLWAHLQAFLGFVDRYSTDFTQRQMAVQRQIAATQVQFSLRVEAEAMGAFHAWVRQVGGIIFLPDASIRDPDGRLLMAPGDGFGDPAAALPYPEDALARKADSETALRAMGLEPLAALPPVFGAGELRLREAREVAGRCLALTAVAVTGELVRDGDPAMHRLALERIPAAGPALSPWERAFIKAEGRRPGLLASLLGGRARYSMEDVAKAVWRYEGAALLLWALGIRESLPFPDRPCDAGALVSEVMALDHQRFQREARLRDPGELLDALDLHYRLHWLTTEHRVNGRGLAVEVHDGVVWERHWTLNWLTRFEDVDWDDITTPT